MRSLDALHLATAEALLPTLRWFVAYDKRLADAARDRGLPVAAPS
jgi:predicted nucleic acid-binding protein